jgi:hypothetical protein
MFDTHFGYKSGDERSLAIFATEELTPTGLRTALDV